jgi:flagellar hook-basal body complex protein FliE
MNDIPDIGRIGGLDELSPSAPAAPRRGGPSFTEALADAIATVDGVQKQSEAAQASYVRGDNVDLHDVLIKVEEAEIAFRTMMEVRNKLVEAYREIMRIGG